jgi:hypothetical protein
MKWLKFTDGWWMLGIDRMYESDDGDEAHDGLGKA